MSEILWLQFVEHRYLAVKAADDFVELRVASLDDERNVLFSVLVAPYLDSLDVVALPLLVAIKPA